MHADSCSDTSLEEPTPIAHCFRDADGLPIINSGKYSSPVITGDPQRDSTSAAVAFVVARQLTTRWGI